MRPKDELERMAQEVCERQARGALRNEPRIEPGEERIEWDQHQLRQVFTQPLVLWRRAAAFEVILDAAGRVAGFVDHEKYNESAEGSLTPEEAQGIVLSIDLLPKGARMIALQAGRAGPNARIYRARYRLAFPLPEYEEVEVEINPTRREVIAVRPIPRKG